MRRIAGSMAVVVWLAAASLGQAVVAVDDIRDQTSDLVSAVAEYTRSNPRAPGAFEPWTGHEVNLLEPILVHTFPDLRPLYYLVLTAGEADEISSVITFDARSGDWQTYARQAGRDDLQFVDRRHAQAIAAERLGRSVDRDRFVAVAMPNRRIYWHAGEEGQDLYVNLWNPKDVRSELDQELTTEPQGVRVDRERADMRQLAPQQEPAQRRSSSRESTRDRYPTSYDIESVPYYWQGTNYHCAPTSLEMVFDYWGEHVSQTDIGRVANTLESHGTWTDDIRRAAHFSYVSTAVQMSTMHGYDERALGYAAAECWWSDPEHEPDRYSDLKTLISSDYPIMVTTQYQAGSSAMHMRVIKGYDDSTNVFIVHDPWTGTPYGGPDVHFNQVFLVDTLWAAANRWGMFAAPWKAEIVAPSPMPRGLESTVMLETTYRGPHPFEGHYPATSSTGVLSLNGGFSFAPGEIDTKTLLAITSTGSFDMAGWQVVAPCSSPPEVMSAQVYGYVSGTSLSYPTGYTDVISGFGEAIVNESTTANAIYVDVNGAGDYPTIQEGIDGAPCDGDWVAVLPGTYSDSLDRNLDFGGRNLVLTGISGADETIIDCSESGRGLYFHSGEDTTSVVTGFTIVNGNEVNYGGGIYCDSSSPRLIDLVLTSNTASYGGGIAWRHAAPVLRDVTISDNIAHSSGGGAYCTDDTLGKLHRVTFDNNYAISNGGGMYSLYSSNTLSDVTFWSNTAQVGGGALLYDSSPTIESALFWQNASGSGGALELAGGSSPHIVNSTISHNDSGSASAAIECDGSWPTIENTIVSFTGGGAGFACLGGGYPLITHSCIYGNAGGDSLCGSGHSDNGFADPLFCDAPAGDFTLRDDSWCLPENNGWAELIGRYGAGDCSGSGVDDPDGPPSVIALASPSPNPSGSAVELVLDIPHGRESLTVAVYSLAGRVVRMIYDGPVDRGRRTFVWDGVDSAGKPVANGVYFVRAVQGPNEASRKIVVIR